jgi:hypothetical protein
MADQEYRDALFIGSDQRSNFKDVVAKRPDLLRRDGGRLGASQNGVTLQAGQVLGYAATGGDANHYKPYNSANTDGSQVAVGVLEQETSVDAAGNGSEISIIRHGCLFQAMLIGLDAGAITNLKATSFVEHGTQLLEF